MKMISSMVECWVEWYSSMDIFFSLSHVLANLLGKCCRTLGNFQKPLLCFDMMHFDCALFFNILRNLTNSDEIILVQNIPDGVIRIQYGGAFGLPHLVHFLLGMPRPGLGFVVSPQGLLPEPRDLLGPFTRDSEPVSSNSHGQLHRGLGLDPGLFVRCLGLQTNGYL